MNGERCLKTIVIVYRLDTNGYLTETCKRTGRNGRRRNIGRSKVSKTVEGTVSKTAGIVVRKTAEDEMNKKTGINRTKEEI